MKGVEIDQSLFGKAVASMPKDALSGVRSTAAGEFMQNGFPTMRHEDWRYTDLSAAIALSNAWMARYEPSASVAKQPQADVQPGTQADIANAVDAHWLRFDNGAIHSGSLPAGVSAAKLSAGDDAVEVIADDALSQFNAALIEDALEISVAAGTAIDKPLGLLICDSVSDESSVSRNRIIIRVHEGASVDLLECYGSTGSAGHYNNSVVQLHLEAGAAANYVRLQQRARHHVQTGKLTAFIAKDAALRHCGFDLGGSLARFDVDVRLNGVNANAELNGLYLAGDGQHIDNHTRVDHLVGPSQSREEYRGILKHKSRCVFNSKAVVHEGADGSDARQANHNLLLSEDAEADTKPELEIYADDVKCSHGATVGQLDENALYYLQTRGLSKETATRLMTRAFAAEVLGAVPVPQIAGYLSAALDARLDDLTGEQNDE